MKHIQKGKRALRMLYCRRPKHGSDINGELKTIRKLTKNWAEEASRGCGDGA